MFVINGDGYDYIHVELDLSQLENGETVMIMDSSRKVKSVSPQNLTYRKSSGQLRLSDKSQSSRSQSSKPVSYTHLQFESKSGLIIIVFKGRSSSSYGGLSGTYRQYTEDEMQGRCSKLNLPPSDAGSLNCEGDFAGMATTCTGSFTCPRHFVATGRAECRGKEWTMVCLPTPAGWNIFNNDCVDSSVNLIT